MQAGYFTSLISNALIGNGSQLLGLQKTGEALQEIGPTQMSVSTYALPTSNTSVYATEIVKIATIPGTSVSLLVYLDQIPNDPEGEGYFFQVTSLSR